MRVETLYFFQAVARDGRRLFTVIAPDEEVAKAETRKALSLPGRELTRQAWLSGGGRVKKVDKIGNSL